MSSFPVALSLTIHYDGRHLPGTGNRGNSCVAAAGRARRGPENPENAGRPPRRKRARGPAFARRRSPDAPSVFCAAARKARKMLLRPRSGTVPPAVPGRRRTERAGKQRSLPPPFPGEETGFGKEVRPRGSFSPPTKIPPRGVSLRGGDVFLRFTGSGTGDR